LTALTAAGYPPGDWIIGCFKLSLHPAPPAKIRKRITTPHFPKTSRYNGFIESMVLAIGREQNLFDEYSASA
jgi:hypothetical protein